MKETTAKNLGRDGGGKGKIKGKAIPVKGCEGP
jgi:hypothetical protein